MASIPAVPQMLHEFSHGERLLQGNTSRFHIMQQSGALRTALQQTGQQLAAAYRQGLSLASCTTLLQSVCRRVEGLSRLFQRTARCALPTTVTQILPFCMPPTAAQPQGGA